MVNKLRGEITASLDGKSWTLCLTLGALAELEEQLEADDLSSLAAKFSSGKLSAKHLLAIIGAGLRGGGHVVNDDEVAEMRVEGGITGYAQIAAELLRATFNTGEQSANPPPPQEANPSPGNR